MKATGLKLIRFNDLVLLLPALSFLFLIRFPLLGLPTNIYEVLIYALAILAFFANPNWRRLSASERLVTVSVLGISILSLLVSHQWRDGLGLIKGWIVPALLIAWMLRRVLTNENTATVLSGMKWQGIGVAVFALAQQIPFVGNRWIDLDATLAQYFQTHRSPSIFNSPNAAAMILVPAFIITIATLKTNLDRVLAFLLFIGLLATGSRAGVLAALLAAVFLSVWQKARPLYTYVLFGITILVFNPIVLGAIALKHPDQLDIRVRIWQKSLELAIAHPFTGIGLRNFHDAFASYTLHLVNFDEFITPYAVHPHNIFLYTWLLFGVLGLLGLVFLFGKTLLVAYHTSNRWSRLGAVLLMAMIIQGMVDNSLWKNDLIIWAVVAFMLVYSHNKATS